MRYYDICKFIGWIRKKNRNAFSVISNLQTNYRLKLDFQMEDQHRGGKLLIHDTKHRKDNQLQSVGRPYRISWLRIQIWYNGADGNVFNPTFYMQ